MQWNRGGTGRWGWNAWIVALGDVDLHIAVPIPAEDDLAVGLLAAGAGCSADDADDGTDDLSIASTGFDRLVTSEGAQVILGPAASTATESYSSARAIRNVRVSEVDNPGPVSVLPSCAIARMDTTSP